MILLKRAVFLLLFGILLLSGVELGQRLVGQDLEAQSSRSCIFSFATTAEAIVGRPLTPVSVAGVARRTARRTVRRRTEILVPSGHQDTVKLADVGLVKKF